jgi:hypothetical protein
MNHYNIHDVNQEFMYNKMKHTSPQLHCSVYTLVDGPQALTASEVR